MGTEKSEIKMALAHELGASFDDALEAATRDGFRWDGAKTSLANAAVAVEALVGLLKKELDSEAKKVGGDAPLDEEGYALGRKWLLRAVDVIRNLRLQAEVQEQRAHGRTEALQTSVMITKRLYDSEEQKLKALQVHEITELAEPETSETGSRRPPSRPIGARPQNKVAMMKAADQAQQSVQSSG